PAPALQAGTRLAGSPRRPRGAGGDPGPDLQSAGGREGRRQRLGTLARADVHPVSPGRDRDRVPSGPHHIQDPAADNMKPVWIVDDDRSIRWVIEKALRREGIAFNSLSSAQEPLDVLPGGTPAVLA